MKKARGIVASGHAQTSRAAAEILRAGGNAYDAVVAAVCAACVAEPLLVSLGGGGFLLAAPTGKAPLVYDFFSQTPARKRAAAELDFFPILADFGADQQEFHIGKGSIAVPGVVAGLFAIHADLGRMPMADVLHPAMALAREGVRVEPMHAYVTRILEPILRADPVTFSLFESSTRPGELLLQGDIQRNPDLANAFEHLARDGLDLFYRGDWARQLAADSRDGGSLGMSDLLEYRVVRRKPLSFSFAGSKCLINPPPSPGGGLIAFALGLLEQALSGDEPWGSREHLLSMVAAMRSATLAREHFGLHEAADEKVMAQLLGPANLQRWRQGLNDHSLFSRGTTHISVADGAGNMASLTASNGEGSAYVLPGTGILLNNMLGEQDLNPAGFHQWQPGRRLASMMSPLVALQADGRKLALGTGGSNRIRSAVTQVMLNTCHFGLPLQQAIDAPRLHLEGHKLSLEPGLDPRFDQWLGQQFGESSPWVHAWPEPNLFFGGVHAVRMGDGQDFEGVGDSRRNGAVEIA